MKVFNGYIKNNTKQIAQYLLFRRDMIHLSSSMKNLGKFFELQKELLKTEMIHDEILSDKWKDKKIKKMSGWTLLKVLFFCTAFSYARSSKSMQELTGFGLKDCLTLPGLGWKYYKSLRTEEEAPI